MRPLSPHTWSIFLWLRTAMTTSHVTSDGDGDDYNVFMTSFRGKRFVR